MKLKEGVVFLKDLRTGVIYEFPLTDFAMEDQLLILKRHELNSHINVNLRDTNHFKKNYFRIKNIQRQCKL